MKRKLIKLALFLILGMIINVAVAWGMARLSPAIFDRTKNSFIDDAQAWAVDKGVVEPVTTPYCGLGMHWVVVHKQVSTTLIYGVEEHVIDYAGMVVHAGWPFDAMKEQTWIDAASSSSYRRVYHTSAGLQSESSWHPPVVAPLRPLPMQPLLPGFLINTLFYAMLLWLLAVGPFTTRRMIRRKRGLCIKCGYDLRGEFLAGCPECGWGREKPDNAAKSIENAPSDPSRTSG